MQTVPLQTLFDAAPTYRRHETDHLATLKLKNPEDPNAPGLWFLEVPERLEIATEKPKVYPTINFGMSLEERRSAYNFEHKIIPAGDAVVNSYLHFKGLYDDMPSHNLDVDDGPSYLPRKRYGPSSMNVKIPGEFGEEYRNKFVRERGALIQFHIPKKLLDENYDYEVEKKQYREKPFRKKFIEQDIMVVQADGSLVEIPAGHEIIFSNENYSVRKCTVKSSVDDWLIDGQDRSFYLSIVSGSLSDKDRSNSAFSKKSSGIFNAMMENLQSPIKNPYESAILMERFLSHHFNARAGLLPEPVLQEFESLREETERKYAYFEAHPVVM